MENLLLPELLMNYSTEIKNYTFVNLSKIEFLMV